MAETARTAPAPVASSAATQDVLPPPVAAYLNAMGFAVRPPVHVPWSPVADCPACKAPAAASPAKGPAAPLATRGAAVTLSARSRGRAMGGRRRASARGRTDAPLTADFQSATNQIRFAAKQQRTHPPATTKRSEVERAAHLPEKDQQDQSSKERNTGKMGDVGQQRLGVSKKFSAKTFTEDLHARVEKAHPESEDDARNMAKRDAVHIEQDFSKRIATEQGTVIDPLKQQASDPKIAGFEAAKKPVPIPAPAYPAAPGRVDPSLVTPKAKPDPEVSLQAESDRLDGAMAKNRLSDDQLAESREPSFLKTLKARQDAQQKIVEARAAYRRQESNVLQGATSQANQSMSSGLLGLNRTHTRIGGGVLGSQKGTETQTQKRQREIKQTIDDIYKRTVDCVKCALETMTKRATSEFTKSLEAETETFNSRVRDRLDSYYSTGKKIKHFFFGEPKVVVNPNGSTRDLTRSDYEGEFPNFRLKEGIKCINPEVYKIFLQEKNLFLGKMDDRLTAIAEDVQIGLTTANEKIEEGRKEVANYIKTLHGDEQRYAKGLQEDVFTKFENLEATIDDAREDLLNTLADQYRDSVNKLETTFNEINDELKKTWIDRAIDFVETVGKTIFQLAELLFTILVRVAYLVWDIVKHPIRFFETLVTGLKEGISSFIDNIGTHLKEAFWTWLTDASPGKTIRLSLGSGVAGLFDLVMQVLSLGIDDLRAIVDKILGPEFLQMVDKGVAFAEKVFEPVIILLKKGPIAFWDYIKESLTDLIQSAFDRIKESVFFAVIKRGIIWIAGFFVPGGGFVKIVKAIVKAFQFVAENLERIRHFFDSVFDALEGATRGETATVASRIITGLKAGIVLALSFLATQLGLGDIIDKVHKILHALRRPIVNALEWILKKAKSFLKKVVTTAKKAAARAVGKKEPEETARPRDGQQPEDLRERAAALLTQRLHAKKSLAESKHVVHEVFARLHPAGLHRLEVLPPEEDGSYPIIAQASDPLCIARLLIPDVKLEDKTIEHVRMVAQLTVGKDPLEHVVTPTGPFKRSAFQPKAHELDPKAEVAWLQPAHPEAAAGIFLKRPEPESDTLEVFSFSTGNPKRFKNVSHAEVQFINWFRGQFKLRKNIKKIALFIERSPCGKCVGDLVDFAEEGWANREDKRSLKQLIGGAKRGLTLHFAKPHEGANPTNLAHLTELKRAGWIVTWDQPVTSRAPEQPVVFERAPLVGSWTKQASRPRRRD